MEKMATTKWDGKVYETELTKEICERKIKYWTEKRIELEFKEREEQENYKKLWGELVLAAGTSLKAVKEKINEQIQK